MPATSIGISACFFHPDPGRKAAPSKTLQWIEQSTAHWVMAGGALPFMVPSPPATRPAASIGFDDYANALDGLVLHGRAPMSGPAVTGEEPLRPEWSGRPGARRLRDRAGARLRGGGQAGVRHLPRACS
jgi:putative glutamine amidotransferase